MIYPAASAMTLNRQVEAVDHLVKFSALVNSLTSK